MKLTIPGLVLALTLLALPAAADGSSPLPVDPIRKGAPEAASPNPAPDSDLFDRVSADEVLLAEPMSWLDLETRGWQAADGATAAMGSAGRATCPVAERACQTEAECDALCCGTFGVEGQCSQRIDQPHIQCCFCLVGGCGV